LTLVPWLTVSKYIRDTFGAAKASMSINGMDAKEMEAELAKAQEGEGVPCT
jgi:kinetochor protein Mis14/NSL1